MGFAIAVLVGAFVTNVGLLYFVGTIFLMVAFILMLQGRPYWLYAALLTPAIVLLESSGSTVDEVADQRLGATLIGVIFTLLVMLALTPLTKQLLASPAVDSKKPSTREE